MIYERFVLQSGAFLGRDRDALQQVNNAHKCYQKDSPDMFEKWN